MDAVQDEKIIFKGHTHPAIAWLSVVAGIAAFAAGIDDNDLSAALTVAPIATGGALAVLWITFRILSRTMLAEVRLVDHMLLCERVDLFNRGGRFSVPISETGQWEREFEQMRRGERDVLRFHHGGRRYFISITEGTFFDAAAFEAIASDRSGSWPAAHADQRRGRDADGDDGDDDRGERVDVR